MGISEEKFWDMNPKRLKPYQIADELTKSHENYLAWMNGIYVYEAVRSGLSGLSGKKSKLIEYPKEPHPMTKREIEEAEKKKMERMKAQFATFVEGLEKQNGRL